MLKDADMDVKYVDVAGAAIKDTYLLWQPHPTYSHLTLLVLWFDSYISNQKTNNVGWELIAFEEMSIGKLDGKPTKK